MDSDAWTHQFWQISKNLHSSALRRHWKWTGGLTKSNIYIYIYIYKVISSVQIIHILPIYIYICNTRNVIRKRNGRITTDYGIENCARNAKNILVCAHPNRSYSGSVWCEGCDRGVQKTKVPLKWTRCKDHR